MRLQKLLIRMQVSEIMLEMGEKYEVQEVMLALVDKAEIFITMFHILKEYCRRRMRSVCSLQEYCVERLKAYEPELHQGYGADGVM
ncbi:MAG: hypothetical protein ACLTML_24600 [Blautia faecis]